jgi:hypothetical protein
MTVECYAQRLLNPFRGTMHTIKYEAAEAVTLDGVHWDIYVTNDFLLEGLSVNRWTQVTDIRFGTWSAEKGLTRGPIYPSDDFIRMEEMGAIVYQYLTQVHRNLPFPFRDRYELWLLDADQRPLALLHSVVEEGEIDLEISPQWRAGYIAQERFLSAAASRLRREETRAADCLTEHVNTRAGKRPGAQWFRRERDRSGSGLQGIDIPVSLAGRQLPADAFPETLIASPEDEAHRQVVEDFHAWQAPWLLTLPELDRSTRAALEDHARRQASLVEKFYRLYPDIVDEKGLKAALVEAILSRAQPQPPQLDTTLPTFYIELNNNPPDWERGR